MLSAAAWKFWLELASTSLCFAHLNDVNFLSAVVPHFKLLAVASDVFSNPDCAHLEAGKPNRDHRSAATRKLYRRSASNLERVLEAVGRTLLVAVSGFIPLLAEQKHLVIEEQMPLHGLEPGQVLHLKAEQH